MSALDLEILAERIIAVERHLKRVEVRLPGTSKDFTIDNDASDAVILHLWQAIQIIIDIALSSSIQLRLGTPSTYADAFQKLADGGYLEKDLATRLSQAAGFRNRIAHAYEKLDMTMVYQIAQKGPADLRAFLSSIKKWFPKADLK